jgi:excisionase family DNA binding protein
MDDSVNALQRRLVDRRVVARTLGLSSETIRRMVARGDLPAYRVAGRLRFDTREIRAWLVQR